MSNRVVIVEDCQMEQGLIMRALSKLPFTPDITMLNSGVEALEYFDEHAPAPAFALVDVNMPLVSGIDLIKALKNTARYKQVPFIAMSSSKHEESIEAAYDAGASAYFHKSTDMVQYQRGLKSLVSYWLFSNTTKVRNQSAIII